MNDVMRMDFTVGMSNSDGERIEETEREVTILWNKTIISNDEIDKLICTGMYEYDPRVIVTTPLQADYLKGVTP